jgi:hypothetical protein
MMEAQEHELAPYFNIIDSGGDAEKDNDARKAINASNNQSNPLVDARTVVLGCRCDCKRINCMLSNNSLDEAVSIVKE